MMQIACLITGFVAGMIIMWLFLKEDDCMD